MPKQLHRDKDAVRDWMCEQLDLYVSPPTKFVIPKDLDAEQLALAKYRALSEARSGDVEKLRQLVSRLLGPEFAVFIHPAKLKRGVKEYPPLPDLSWVIVSLIKAIWRKHYKKRRYRRREDGYTDEEIAAYYLGDSEEHLRKNPLHRRKKKPRAR